MESGSSVFIVVSDVHIDGFTYEDGAHIDLWLVSVEDELFCFRGLLWCGRMEGRLVGLDSVSSFLVEAADLFIEGL